jgi:alkylation response protein AidB-like acyl-CoA dehydrogenase
MDFRFTTEQENFRREFSTWLSQNLPQDWEDSQYRVYESAQEWENQHRELQRKISQAGFAGMHYPKEYGGQGRTLAEEIIVLETMASKCMELRIPGIISFGMAAPTLLLCGNEKQKSEFIPKILDGTHIWCQGFSEPNAGSDVVNVGTSAVKKGDHYIVNGQKIWTSFAHMADYCILLVRTDPQASKHKGLSYLLLDMKTPGVDVRPIVQITGEAEFNEVFLEDVKVPQDMLVGQEGQGWNIAITTLMFERALGDAVMAEAFGRNGRLMIEMARQTKRSGRPVIDDPICRQKLAQVLIELKALKYHGYRSLSQLMGGSMPGAEGSIGKLLWSEHNQRANASAMQILGPWSQLVRGSDWAVQGGMWPYAFLRSKGNTIEAGTSEIQRNIIGERVLGLPKDITRLARQ